MKASHSTFLQINVGLDRNDGKGTITGPDVIDYLMLGLEEQGLSLESVKIRYEQSQTERTAVIVANVEGPGGIVEVHEAVHTALFNMSKVLYQDCVAAIIGSKPGTLIGPLADKWGTFNQEYFINY